MTYELLNTIVPLTEPTPHWTASNHKNAPFWAAKMGRKIKTKKSQLITIFFLSASLQQ